MEKSKKTSRNLKFCRAFWDICAWRQVYHVIELIQTTLGRNLELQEWIGIIIRAEREETCQGFKQQSFTQILQIVHEKHHFYHRQTTNSDQRNRERL